MLLNYLKVIFRNFITDRMYTLINIFGLSVGIAASLMIAQYVQFELSFDRDIKHTDPVYRMYMRLRGQGWEVDHGGHPAIGSYLKKNFPDITSLARIIPVGLEWNREYLLRRENQEGDYVFSKEIGFFYAEPEILQMFAIPMIEGNPEVALNEPNSIVITKAIADKFFLRESALNKTLILQTSHGLKDYQVTGVTPNPSANSTLQYSALLSMKDGDEVFLKTTGRKVDDIWHYPSVCITYVTLTPGVNVNQVTEKFNEALTEPFSEWEKKFSIKNSIWFLPFTEVHFYRPMGWGTTIRFTGDKRVVIFFTTLAILIMVISWVNYINLTTARALKRAKEVGLRKVNGASRKNIVLQFLLEFFILNLISLLLALTFVQVFFPFFIATMGSSAKWIFWKEPIFWIMVTILLLVSTLASGCYPAFVLSRYNPSKVLKGSFSRSSTGSQLRRGLVLGQFGLAAFLLLSIYVVFEQLLYMQNKDVGIDTEQVMIVRTNEIDTTLDRRVAFQRWKQQVETINNIVSTAASSRSPGDLGQQKGFYHRSLDESQDQRWFFPNLVSKEFFNTIGMTLLAGREFQDQPGEMYKVILNETAARSLGFEDLVDAIGTSIGNRRYSYDSTHAYDYEIIGIVKDSNVRVNWGPAPVIFLFDKSTLSPLPAEIAFDNFIVKLSGNDVSHTIGQLKKVWEQLFQGVPFDYYFLDTYFDTFYKEERHFASVFGFFCLIAVVISCLGLFGLSSYNTASRTKEIGIRKSLGATAANLVWMFSRDYLRLVLIAATIGIPVGILLLNKWLNNYPDRISIQADIIIVPLILLVSISVVTVGVQTFKSAQADPVKALKNE